jgi:threonine/homoserine/homoserine lactone efflux protein
MELGIFWKGLILGFSLAAPVGPIGILCIRRTLHFGKISGLFSGLGAAVADALYAALAAFGIGFVSDFLKAQHFWLKLIGAAFLLFLGWRTFFAKYETQTKKISHTTLVNDFISTFFLMISNPILILVFLAVFASFGLANVQGNMIKSSALILGVFLGSSAWWLLLIEVVTLFRKKINDKGMQWINRGAGTVIAIFGIGALCTLFF